MHLRGLWHQHFLPNGIAPIAQSVRNALHEYGVVSMTEQARQAQAAGEERYSDEEDIARFVNEAVYGNLDRREGDSKMTGEWLVFVPHEGCNYYLAIANHSFAAVTGHCRAAYAQCGVC